MSKHLAWLVCATLLFEVKRTPYRLKRKRLGDRGMYKPNRGIYITCSTSLQRRLAIVPESSSSIYFIIDTCGSRYTPAPCVIALDHRVVLAVAVMVLILEATDSKINLYCSFTSSLLSTNIRTLSCWRCDALTPLRSMFRCSATLRTE